MAAYGYGASPGKLGFTGNTIALSSGDDVNAPAVAGYVNFIGLSAYDKRLASILRRRSNQKARNVWRALTGAVPGTNFSTNYSKVDPPDGTAGSVGDSYNSVRPITTVSVPGVVSTSADLTAFAALIDRVVYPSSYPVDKSGNGGGDKITW